MESPRELTGLVLRTTDIREADRMITLYTKEAGILSALAVGARSYKSRKMAATSQFCYGKFMIGKRGEFYRVIDADLQESFFGMRDSLEGLALASYLVDVLEDVAVSEPDETLLRLTLNALYAVSEKIAPLWKIKAAFEIRLAAQIGFLPDVLACASCGEKGGNFYFNIMDGSLQCYACRQKQIEEKREADPSLGEAYIVSMLSEGAKIALAYCIYAPLEKLYAFHISDEDARLFSRAAETYLLNHLERSFKTLDFYKSVERP